MNNIFRKTIWMFLFLVIINPSVYAQNISVDAEVNKNKIAVGSSVRLSVHVHGTQNASPAELPTIEGLESRYLGPATQVSIINGQVSSSITFNYNLLTLKAGKFTVPSFNVSVDGKDYPTQPIEIEVVDNASALNTPLSSEPSNLKDKIFLVLKTSKNEIYLGEPLPIKIMLFVSKVNARDIQFPVLEKNGFSMDDIGQPQQYQQMIGGTPFEILEFDTRIYPTKEGELKLGPARTQCNLLVPSSSQGSEDSPMGMDDFFNDDFFNKFFDRYEKYPINLESADVTLNILPLPEGQPEGFEGAVGDFKFEASVSPSDVKAGDPITLRMRIEGEGDLKSLKMPEFKDPNNQFKIYDPQIKQDGQAKTVEQVIIPMSDKVKEIPEIKFSYFDINLKQYKTITQGPFSIHVAPSEEKENFKVMDFGRTNQLAVQAPSETLGKDIVYIKEQSDPFLTESERRNRLRLNRIFILGLVVVLIGWFVYGHVRRNFATDPISTQKTAASKEVQKDLEELKRFLTDGKKNEFYDKVFKTLQRYISRKFNVSVGEISAERVNAVLLSGGVYQSVADDVKSILEECEIVRYASAQIPDERMQTTLLKLQNTISQLEKRLR